jgi:Prokaryotic RING finger family 1
MSDAPQIRSQPLSSGASCPLCREELGELGRYSCPSCQTPYHRECHAELGGCATLGCARRNDRAAAVAAQEEAWRRPVPHHSRGVVGVSSAARGREVGGRGRILGIPHWVGSLLMLTAPVLLVVGIWLVKAALASVTDPEAVAPVSDAMAKGFVLAGLAPVLFFAGYFVAGGRARLVSRQRTIWNGGSSRSNLEFY